MARSSSSEEEDDASVADTHSRGQSQKSRHKGRSKESRVNWRTNGAEDEMYELLAGWQACMKEADWDKHIQHTADRILALGAWEQPTPLVMVSSTQNACLLKILTSFCRRSATGTRTIGKIRKRGVRRAKLRSKRRPRRRKPSFSRHRVVWLRRSFGRRTTSTPECRLVSVATSPPCAPSCSRASRRTSGTTMRSFPMLPLLKLKLRRRCKSAYHRRCSSTACTD